MGGFIIGAQANQGVIHFDCLERRNIESLIRLESIATPTAWTASKLTDSFDAGAECKLILQGGRTVGYYVIQRVLDEAELLNFVIFKEFQAKGLGSLALEALQCDLKSGCVKKLFLEVRASNAAARHVYEKTGFSVLNVRKNYYRPDYKGQFTAEDALVMCARLSSGKDAL